MSKKCKGLKTCILCGCSSIEKIYISVPESRKNDWFNFTKNSKVLMRGSVYFCENHLDI